MVEQTADEAVQDALKAMTGGDWDGAVDLLSNVLSTAPDHPLAAKLRELAVGTAEPEVRSQGERRFLTIAFIDLVGSTTISEQLDPEEFRDLLERYQSILRTTAEEYGGHVAKLLGDGAILYFGYPTAFEDAARRGCLAGLAITDAVRAAKPDFLQRFGVDVDCRIGIHSGVTVIGEAGASTSLAADDVVGEVPSVAARLEGLAGPGGVAISSLTHSLVEGLFAFESLGLSDIRGLSAPIEVFRITGTGGVSISERRRLDTVALVGRSDERRLLEDKWTTAMSEKGGLVALIGDAGIGKSRLLADMRSSVDEAGGLWLEGAATELRTSSAFHLPIDLVERHLREAGIDRSDLQRAAAHLDVEPGDLAALLAPADADTGPERRSPLQLRRIAMSTMIDWIDRAASLRPVFVALEDLHWADPSSLEFTADLAELARSRHIIVAATSRSWPVDPMLNADVRLDLVPLEASEIESLASEIAGAAGLAEVVRRQVVERSGGNPLFVREIVRSLGSALSSGDAREIPTSLQGLLSARLDSFGPAKRAAQLASILGREFDPRVVEALAMHGDRLLEWLGELQTGGLLESGDTAGHLRFSHALVQDAAYESLLRSDRSELHGRAADELSNSQAELVAQAPELLAHHLTQAGRTEPAVRQWMAAGRVAARRSASPEAVAHYRAALSLLPQIADDPLRNDLEYRINIALAPALTAVFGYAASEVEVAYRRASDLAVEGGDVSRQFMTTRGLASTHLLRAEIDRAAVLANRALDIAGESGETEFLLEATSWSGTTAFFGGRFSEASNRFTETADLYDPVEHRHHGLQFGIDPLVLSDTHRSWLWHLQGETARGLELVQRTVAFARELGHPLSLAHSLNYLAGLSQMTGDLDTVITTATEEVALAVEYGYPHYTHYGGIFLGHARAKSEDGDTVETERSLAARLETGAALALPYHLYLVADLIGETDPDTALAKLDEAIDVASRTGELWWVPEIHRMRGVLFGRQRHETRALMEFERAGRFAEQAGSGLLALAAATDVFRLTNDPAPLRRALQLVPADAPQATEARSLLG